MELLLAIVIATSEPEVDMCSHIRAELIYAVERDIITAEEAIEIDSRCFNYLFF